METCIPPEFLAFIQATAKTGLLTIEWSDMRVLLRLLILDAFAAYHVDEMATEEETAAQPPAPSGDNDNDNDVVPNSQPSPTRPSLPHVLAPNAPPAAMGALLELDESFAHAPPFTVQRICELVLNPRACYRTWDKFSYAVEKCLLVCGTL